MGIATFNAENLFARYRFKEGVPLVLDDGFTVNDPKASDHCPVYMNIELV